MKLHYKTKGYLAVIISIIAMSNVYIFSKAALNDILLPKFGFYWFGFALFFNSAYLIKDKKNVNLSSVRGKLKILSILGVFEIIGTSTFFLAINAFTNPALVPFYGSIGPILVVILGIIFLKEKFNKIEIFGAILIIIGTFIISYKDGTLFPKEIITGLTYILISKLIFSISTIISKKNIVKLPPSVLSINRTIYLFVFSFAALIYTGDGFQIESKTLTNIILGSLLGPFLAALAGYYALKYIDASKASILGSAKSLMVMFTTYLFFGMLPMNHQILGGMLTIIGIIVITYGKKLLRDKK